MGFFKMDKSWYKTHDMFLRKGCIVTNYILDKIDNDENYAQVIRRLCRYMTVDPLAMKSKDYAGNLVEQPDLKDSLLIATTEGTFFNYVDENGAEQQFKSKQCLFNESFDQGMKRSDQCFVFVHNYRNKPTSQSDGEIDVRIDVVIPNKYDEINDFDTGMKIKRGGAIAILIDDMLNHRVIEDEKYSKYLGNIEFEFLDFGSVRLTKTSDGIVYSLIYRLRTARGEIYNGNL